MTNPTLVTKPALILDDTPSAARKMAEAMRAIGGVPVVFDLSIPAFKRREGIQNNLAQDAHLAKMAAVLAGYSAVICDNNFGEQDTKKPGVQFSDGWPTGIDFLINEIGPALNLIEPEKRPLVICFAPSSSEAIRLNTDRLWKKFGIVAFHKQFEAAAIGLYFRFAQEFGLLMEADTFVAKILGLDRSEINWNTEETERLNELSMSINHMFHGEDWEQVEGCAKPMSLDDVMDALTEFLDISPEIFLQRIQKEGGNIAGYGLERQSSSSSSKER